MNSSQEDSKPQRDKRTNRPNKPKNESDSSSPRNGGGEDSSPRGRNGNPKNKQNRGASFNQKRDESSEKKAMAPIGNERFDNTHTLGGNSPAAPNAALADAKRVAEIIPSNSISAEVHKKVQSIMEVVPDVEYHIVYGALEDLKFDESAAINYLLNWKKESEDKARQAQTAQTGGSWNNVVKKGIKPGPTPTNQQNYPQVQNQQRRNKDDHRPQHAAPQQVAPQHVAPQQNIHQHPQQVPQQNPPQQHIPQQPAHEQHMQPEQIVFSLEEAIANQLHMIQQQTQMLHALQNELRNVTQGGGNEMQVLLDERDLLEHRKHELVNELEHLDARLEELEIDIKDKERMKNERIKDLASRSAQLGFLSKQQHRPVQGYAQQ